MISILCHLYYHELWNEISQSIKNVNLDKKIYINLVNDKPEAKLQTMTQIIKSTFPDAIVIISKNQGRDIGGYLRLIDRWMDDGGPGEYLVLCHTKTRKESWRRELMNSVFSNIDCTLSFFKDPNVGMVGSAKWLFSQNRDSNRNIYDGYCRRFGFNTNRPIQFIAGTIFCVRSIIFKSFFHEFNALQLAEELEGGPDIREPSKTHTWERLFGAIATESYVIMPSDYLSTITDMFDERFYLENNPDVKEAIRNGDEHSAYSHFLKHGRNEGRPISKTEFNENFYFENNPDVKNSGQSAYGHFLKHGFSENRKFIWGDKNA